MALVKRRLLYFPRVFCRQGSRETHPPVEEGLPPIVEHSGVYAVLVRLTKHDPVFTVYDILRREFSKCGGACTGLVDLVAACGCDREDLAVGKSQRDGCGRASDRHPANLVAGECVGRCQGK